MSSLLDIPYQVIISAADSQIAFDATVQETHAGKLDITEHPVERGADVSDHAKKAPDSLQISGIISDTPILLNGADKQPSVPGGDPERRAQQAYDEFVRLQDTAALLEVATEIRTYSDMMIESISVIRDATKRHILDIGLGLRVFRRASVETIEAPQPVEPAHKPKGKGGRKPKKDPPKEVEEKSTSLFEDIAGAVSGIGGG